MNIMIDYDGTYTADPTMWRNIISYMKLSGNKVFLVTSRDPDAPIELNHDFIEMNVPVIYCSWRAKRVVCDEQGIFIDIWIDNDPYYIDTGFIEEQVKAIKLKYSGDKDLVILALEGT